MTRQTRRYAASFRIAEPIVSPAALVAGLGLYGIHVGTLRWGQAAWAKPMTLPIRAPGGPWWPMPACLQNLISP